MRRSRPTPIIAAAILALIISGCSGNKPRISNELQKSFVDKISASDLTRSLQVKPLSDNVYEPRFGKLFNIAVINISDKPIYFSTNPAPIRLFIIQGGKWVQIRNDVTFMSYEQGGDSFGVLSAKAEHSNVMTPPVVPALGSISNIGNEPVILRILAIGEFMANGQRTGDRVGAYADSFIRLP